MVETDTQVANIKKRKKYAPRCGMVCPTCGSGLRTCFYTLGVGGMRAISGHGVCVQCNVVYKLDLKSVNVVGTEIKQPEVNVV